MATIAINLRRVTSTLYNPRTQRKLQAQIPNLNTLSKCRQLEALGSHQTGQGPLASGILMSTDDEKNEDLGFSAPVQKPHTPTPENFRRI